MDKVSIITPVYNRAHLIINCINSIISQTHKDWELLIIDDHSTDDIKEVIHKISEKDHRVKYFLNDKKGAPSARNAGLKVAGGKYVLFLDSDDEVVPDKLEKHLKVFNEDLKLDVTVSQVVRKEYEQVQSISNIKPGSSLITEFISKKIVWKIHAPVWKRKFLTSNYLLFEEILKNSQDYQFYSYCVLNNPGVSYLFEPLSIINDFDSSVDPAKIRGSLDTTTLYNHLLSRIMVWRYAKKRVSLMIKFHIYFYVQRHKVNCFKKALANGFSSFLQLLKLSVTI